jgi:hypothetical protein
MLSEIRYLMVAEEDSFFRGWRAFFLASQCKALESLTCVIQTPQILGERWQDEVRIEMEEMSRKRSRKIPTIIFLETQQTEL